MPVSSRGIFALVIAALVIAIIPGCGSRAGTEDSAWRKDVDESLHILEESRSFRYRMHLETWIEVSGKSVYGDEKSEGSYLDGDFSADITRTSPSGEEDLVFCSQAGAYCLRRGETWSIINSLEAPNPLYDPERLIKLLLAYDSISLQEEEGDGTARKRYLLGLGEDGARETMTESAWSYFSNLHFELKCTIWVSSPSEPPSSLQVEVVGLDPRESLQRYRALVSVDLLDFDAPDVQLVLPGE
jgi:hypothetical protein